ncbi:hypothetical protein WL13_00530 [Burkholderia ubonensis]|nr:hypothetical protein WI76_11020 [Burkholderia ubonensis]KVZ16637.1 hypothetical protein WL13_00530 [Burkholderia ubonensis]KWB22454.1 hypothetical protein WL33_02165 [Burkholderia ubonensis]KWC29512.1 hypothetical protein WL50_29245 [Burkholderia ubonensis]
MRPGDAAEANQEMTDLIKYYFGGRALTIVAARSSYAGKTQRNQGNPEKREELLQTMIAGLTHIYRYDVAAAITEGHHLVALQMLVSAVTEVVAAFLRGRRRAVTVNDPKLKQRIVMKPAYRSGKNRIDATIGLPTPQRAIDARMMNFRTATGVPLDGQHLPLAAHIQQLQHVAKQPVQTQLRCRSPLAHAQMRQDKFLKLLLAQFHGYCPSALTSSHPDSAEIWTLPDPACLIEYPVPARLADKFHGHTKPATSC